MWAGPVSGEPVVDYRSHDQHYAASMMKVALVSAAYREAERGCLDLDAAVMVHNSFRSAGDGSSYAIDPDDDSDAQVWRRIGQRVALRWLCYRAIVRSSNLATNLVLEVVGVPAVEQVLAAAGATGSSVKRGIEDGTARAVGLHNTVTATDLARLFQGLMTGRLASERSCAEIVSVLAAQQINDALPRGLPGGTWVAHKSGWMTGVSHDGGIVQPPDGEPFIFVICTTSDLAEQEGLDLIAAAAAAAWEDRKVLG